MASLVLGGAIGPAPDRVRLWSPGINPWDGEPQINLTPAAAARVIAAFEARGNPLSMDFDHAQSMAEQRAAKAGPDVTPEQTPGAGYCALELVETPDGLAIDFLPRWSDCGREAPVPEVVCCAKHQIESGQRCEFSPDWLGDEITGEPIRVNRISLVGDGAMHGIGLLASRAAVNRRAKMADPMGEARAAYAYHARMASAGGDNAKGHEAMAAEIKAHAAGLGVDLDKAAEEAPGEPAPVEPKGDAPKVAAEPPPPGDGPPKPPGEEKPKEAAASLASRSAVSAADILTQVRRGLADDRALMDLLATNADRLTDKTREFLASRGLAETRTYLATLAPRPLTDPGTGGDTGGAIKPGAIMRRHRVSLTEGDRYLASRVHGALEKSEESSAAFDQRPEVSLDEQGRATYSFSLVEIAKRKSTEQRTTRTGKAAA